MQQFSTCEGLIDTPVLYVLIKVPNKAAALWIQGPPGQLVCYDDIICFTENEQKKQQNNTKQNKNILGNISTFILTASAPFRKVKNLCERNHSQVESIQAVNLPASLHPSEFNRDQTEKPELQSYIWQKPSTSLWETDKIMQEVTNSGYYF